MENGALRNPHDLDAVPTEFKRYETIRKLDCLNFPDARFSNRAIKHFQMSFKISDCTWNFYVYKNLVSSFKISKLIKMWFLRKSISETQFRSFQTKPLYIIWAQFHLAMILYIWKPFSRWSQILWTLTDGAYNYAFKNILFCYAVPERTRLPMIETNEVAYSRLAKVILSVWLILFLESFISTVKFYFYQKKAGLLLYHENKTDSC